MFETTTTTTGQSGIPVNVSISVDKKQIATFAVAIFVALLLALIISKKV